MAYNPTTEIKGKGFTPNGYSFSEVGKGLSGGEGNGDGREPKGENSNEYSLSHNGKTLGNKSDNINSYSASKIGRSLG